LLKPIIAPGVWAKQDRAEVRFVTARLTKSDHHALLWAQNECFAAVRNQLGWNGLRLSQFAYHLVGVSAFWWYIDVNS
jgi:hypothetical protein